MKCELCRHRGDPKKTGPLAVANPACCEVCPRGAVIYGKRDDLLKQAKARVAANPKAYNPHIYGEKDGGGTQVLYLTAAGVSFQDIGLPKLEEESAGALLRDGLPRPVPAGHHAGGAVRRHGLPDRPEQEEGRGGPLT